jgi:hypothetical protein
MTAFLLVGNRAQSAAERSPAMAASTAAALIAWHGGLRRWGLLHSFALPDPVTGEAMLCLVIQASGPAAARQLATRWGRLGGYLVTVLELRDANERRAS